MNPYEFGDQTTRMVDELLQNPDATVEEVEELLQSRAEEFRELRDSLSGEELERFIELNDMRNRLLSIQSDLSPDMSDEVREDAWTELEGLVDDPRTMGYAKDLAEKVSEFEAKEAEEAERKSAMDKEIAEEVQNYYNAPAETENPPVEASLAEMLPTSQPEQQPFGGQIQNAPRMVPAGHEDDPYKPRPIVRTGGGRVRFMR